MSGLLPGFADPVLDAQSSFRAVLEAMSRPGRVQRLPRAPSPPAPLGAAAGAVLLALVDSATPLFIDAGADAVEWVRFHAGCPIVPGAGEAEFVLCTGTAPRLASLRQGTDEEPQGSATLILQVDALEEGTGWRLTGPGIEREHGLRVRGLPEGFLAEWKANGARFPRGVDVILCDGDRIAALPRSLRIEEG
ncbi:phosphonate C-P lyase system protein PhnH [Roseomonas sp. SSH11]|uniref:Phosphonate C-P lyase system protein PhnH n=1 Tax=Pararoseomonas baculiformis TaxID=2820812 RepID=A0ABS4AAR5_9PROT|nr:phosphonate C-P lyase system protein PhnH [Pararoseomonas baculiformis]MBP0444090.1 phosphonate C-P lyase system protein PhnH [Pararoseomonas baculiformis]